MNPGERAVLEDRGEPLGRRRLALPAAAEAVVVLGLAQLAEPVDAEDQQEPRVALRFTLLPLVQLGGEFREGGGQPGTVGRGGVR